MSGSANLLLLIQTDQPADLGPGPRPGRWPIDKINASLKQCSGSIEPARLELVRALVLLWHDHLDPAHGIVQDLSEPNGAFVHGILHRREPDYSNAKYWFTRVGEHPAFLPLAKKVSALLETSGAGNLKTLLSPQNRWDPFAFVDHCQRAAGLPAHDPQTTLLRQIQQAETQTLLDHFGA